MIIKKSEAKNWIKTSLISLVALTILTGAFKLYHDSKFVKGEYDIVCPQNYGDPISLERCYWPYKFEGESLINALKLEIAAMIAIPFLIFILSLV